MDALENFQHMYIAISRVHSALCVNLYQFIVYQQITLLYLLSLETVVGSTGDPGKPGTCSKTLTVVFRLAGFQLF